ncbi:MAG: enoyl-CoA hydratase/isomerase family protein [Anaerolineales bacterium]|jgi:2-(1,2-epoxy-1,2-dihydrophenyl)acetyl-CoA isomerase
MRGEINNIMGTHVLFQVSAPIATITLNRAERHNSLTPDFLREFMAVLGAIQGEESVRAVILQAKGRSFSTGGDLRGFYEHLDQIETYSNEVVGLLNDVILAMRDLRDPIITAVHGLVFGGSLGFLLASDIVLVTPEVTITPYYSVVGFSPDGGWTAILPQIIGPKRASEILMRNQSITAEQAVCWGIANHIVPTKDIHHLAREIAHEIAAQQTESIYQTKRLLSHFGNDLTVNLEEERKRFVEHISKLETQQSMIDFLDTM